MLLHIKSWLLCTILVSRGCGPGKRSMLDKEQGHDLDMPENDDNELDMPEDEDEDEDVEFPGYQGTMYEADCPGPSVRWMDIIQIPWGYPNRAALTVPPGVKLAPSKIPGAGLGILATAFLPRYTWLAEYQGEIVQDADLISNYAWDIRRSDEVAHFIDAAHEMTSNWLRYVNCPRHVREQNVIPVQCLGKRFYVTTKDIHPGEEMLVYYGDHYAQTKLDIDIDNYLNMDVNITLT